MARHAAGAPRSFPRLTLGTLPLVALLALAALVHVARPSWMSSAFNWAFHPPVFAVSTAGILVLLRVRRRSDRPYRSAFALALVVGFAGEGLQVIGPGDPSWGDLGRDLIGIVGALAAFAALDRRFWADRRGLLRFVYAAVGVALLSATFVPLVWVGYVFAQRSAAVPVLLTFDSRWEHSLFADSHESAPVTVPVPADWPLSEGRAAILTLDDPEYPGLNIHDPYPDWSGFDTLTFVAASMTQGPVEFRLRIHDRAHDHRQSRDRFVRDFVVGPYPERFTVSLAEVADAPEGRRLDLTAIDGLILYSRQRHRGDRVMVDDLRLR